MRMRTTTKVALLLAVSGFCSLVYQVAWLRLLRLIFGASTAASAATVAIFMGGLGLGGWLLGRRVDRSRKPFRFYAAVELGITLTAAASPLLVLVAEAVYFGAGGSAQLGTWGATLLRIVLATLVLGASTFLMGGTLPAAARAVESSGDLGRRSTALLYGANTVGAVLGALVPTFLTLEVLGVRATIFAAAGVNLLVAGTAFLWARGGLGEDPAEEPAEEPAAPAKASQKSSAPAAPLGLVLGAAAGVGFAFFLMELVWYRMLAPLLGGSSYTFGLILAVALLGIGLGGLLYGMGAKDRRPTLVSFAATCSLEALLLIVPFALGDRLAVFALLTRPLGDAGFLPLVGAWSLVAAVVVLPAAVVAGYQFPLLVAVLGPGRRDVGREVGMTYAANTLGAIVGSLAGGFGLMPLLTAPGTWRTVTGLLLALAGAALVFGLRGGAPRRGLATTLAAGLAAVVLLGAAGPSAFWRHSPIGAGRVQATFQDANELAEIVSERRLAVVWEAEGVESSIALDALNQYIFTVNGKADGSALRDAPNMVMSVLVGALLHPDPRHTLVIGLGAGTSAGWLAEVPTVETVKVAELEPAVGHIAEVCAPVNFDVLNHPKVEMVWGDGRELLLTTDERFDLIFSQPSNPYRAGIASLFSREFYEAASEHLNEGGLLLQWLQGYETDGRGVRLAYATLASVFPHVESWRVHENDLLLVASKTPVDHRPEELRRRLAAEPFRSGMERTWGVADLEGLYSGYLGGDGLARALAEGHEGPLHTDDQPVLEFGFVRSLGRETRFDLRQLRRLAETVGEERPPGTEDAVDWNRVRELATVGPVLWGGVPEPEPELDPEQVVRVRARAAYRRGELAETLRLWSAQPSGPQSPLDELLRAEALAEAADPRTPEAVSLLTPRQPLEAQGVLARWRARRGETDAAVRHLVRLFEGARSEPWVNSALLARSLLLAPEVAARAAQAGHAEPGRQLFDALEPGFSVALLDELRHRMRLELAKHTSFDELCVEALAPLEPWPPWDGRLLLDRAECYRRTDHRREADARADIDRYLAALPPRLEEGLAR